MEEGGANLAMEEPSEMHFIGFDFSTQQVRPGVSQSDSHCEFQQQKTAESCLVFAYNKTFV